MIALLATVLPNVGPIEVEEKFLVPGRAGPVAEPRVERRLRPSSPLSGPSVLVEIW